MVNKTLKRRIEEILEEGMKQFQTIEDNSQDPKEKTQKSKPNSMSVIDVIKILRNDEIDTPYEEVKDIFKEVAGKYGTPAETYTGFCFADNNKTVIPYVRFKKTVKETMHSK